jgi:hypothetical protein
MPETPQQYTKRILSNVEDHDPLKVQATTPKKLQRLLNGLSSAKLRKRPGPEKWSVAEILAHLADAELVVSWRMRAVLGAPGTPIQAYDEKAWVAALHYDKRNAQDSLAQFVALREANLTLFKSLAPEQWKHFGMHAERGEESVERMVQMIAGHDLNHVRQIESIVGAGKK